MVLGSSFGIPYEFSDPDGATLTLDAVVAFNDGLLEYLGCDALAPPTVCNFRAPADFVGDTVATFTVSDGQVTTNATWTIHVQPDPVPVAPIASDSFDKSWSGFARSVVLEAFDANADTLTYTIVTPPSNGSVSCIGKTCSYTPNSGFLGDDTFTWTASDGVFLSNTGTAIIRVEQGPRDQTFTTIGQEPLAQFQLITTNFVSYLGVLSTTTHGVLDCPTLESQTFPVRCTYTAAEGFVGVDSFTWVAGGNGFSVVVTVTINVDPPPITYAVTAVANPVAGGTVTCLPDPVNHGSTTECTATANAGYILTGLAGCSGSSAISPYTTPAITAACTVTASFTAGVRFVVTSTAESGPGTWTSAVTIINNQTCDAPTKRIEFNIPAATDPGCNPATGVCVVQLGTGTAIVCPNVVVDGYSQPGAVANTATDHTNNAQLKIEFAGTSTLFLGHDGITLRGIAFAAVQVGIGVRNVFGAGLVNTFSQVLAGNYFGWRADGLTPAGFNGEHRLAINNGQSVNVIGARVGGPNPADRNLITHTLHGNGLRLSGASNALVEGNVFNLDRNGNPAAGANSSQGILLDAGGNNANTIRRNVITQTKVSGVQCTGGSSTTLSENEIFDVGSSGAANARGIELQPGCNRNQTAPVITSVTEGASVTVLGTLNSVANETYKIEFFHNSVADTQNLGRAEKFVDVVQITTNAAGFATFSATLPASFAMFPQRQRGFRRVIHRKFPASIPAHCRH
ncbi:MAG: right-handed parallel beta-helix repeat-containing protein [Betaproteobacteria bacterium]|nr:right-handed parallel beta-helix repeat-containing protein [Betaproteobacteria bacterium]